MIKKSYTAYNNICMCLWYLKNWKKDNVFVLLLNSKKFNWQTCIDLNLQDYCNYQNMNTKTGSLAPNPKWEKLFICSTFLRIQMMVYIVIKLFYDIWSNFLVGNYH